MKLDVNSALIGGPSDWRASVLVVPWFAAFMTLSAWVLFAMGILKNSVRASGESCHASDIVTGGRPGKSTGSGRKKPAISMQTALDPPVTHVAVVMHCQVVPPPPALFIA
jgi:hypothetical protein